jgi:hypothetical protein
MGWAIRLRDETDLTDTAHYFCVWHEEDFGFARI